MSIARTILFLAVLVSDSPASAQRPAMTIGELKEVIGQSSEQGLSQEQATRLADACLAGIEQSTGNSDALIRFSARCIISRR